MNDSININVLNYLLNKLEHRTRSIIKRKTKYTEEPTIPTSEFIIFVNEVQEDLKQSIAVIKKLLQDNKQMENMFLNRTLTCSNEDVSKVISDLKQDNNCLIAEIENLKLQLMYNNCNSNIKGVKYNNNEYRNYSEETMKTKEEIKNMNKVLFDMKKNKLQIKQEIKKHFSNNSSNVILKEEECNDEDKRKSVYQNYDKKLKKGNHKNNRNRKIRNRPEFIQYTSPYGKLFTQIYKDNNKE